MDRHRLVFEAYSLLLSARRQDTTSGLLVDKDGYYQSLEKLATVIANPEIGKQSPANLLTPR